eukprot:CAMPEP_0181439670 /NCGR_PEP_ID=MMETSP1110-20121109/22552_1 /TAXON_ID=174948 /ORGANISM="Symbiodinium sp., Strain CCMP421" /LENGTH=41 /DNA_ID= /DNA_START= /DNA_END= /DNA_ORIENTATION=
MEASGESSLTEGVQQHCDCPMSDRSLRPTRRCPRVQGQRKT